MAFGKLIGKEGKEKLVIDTDNALLYKKEDGTLGQKEKTTAFTEVVKEAGKVVDMDKGTVLLSTKTEKGEYENYFVNKDKDNNIVLKNTDNPKDKSNFIYFNPKQKDENSYYYQLSSSNGAIEKVNNISIKEVKRNENNSLYLESSVTLANNDLKQELKEKGKNHTAIISKEGYKIVHNDNLHNKAQEKEQVQTQDEKKKITKTFKKSKKAQELEQEKER